MNLVFSWNTGSNRINFKVDRKIELIGLGLYGRVNVPESTQVTIEVMYRVQLEFNLCKKQVSKLKADAIATNEVTLDTDGTDKTCKVKFKVFFT